MLPSSIVVVFNSGVRNFGCKQENQKILNLGFEVNITTMEMMEDSESKYIPVYHESGTYLKNVPKKWSIPPTQATIEAPNCLSFLSTPRLLNHILTTEMCLESDKKSSTVPLGPIVVFLHTRM